MAVERLVSPVAEPLAEERNWSLRPKRMSEYIGQTDLIERLDIAIRAVKARQEPMEHVLLHGPPGLGKTTLAHVIAEEMGSKVHITSGPALTRPTDLVGALTRVAHGDVVFIDEIHRLPIAVEEFIYPAMEDFCIDVRMESGLNAQTVQLNVKPVHPHYLRLSVPSPLETGRHRSHSAHMRKTPGTFGVLKVQPIAAAPRSLPPPPVGLSENRPCQNRAQPTRASRHSTCRHDASPFWSRLACSRCLPYPRRASQFLPSESCRAGIGRSRTR